MAITKKQRIAMAVIVLVGVMAGGGLLLTERHKTGEEAEQAQNTNEAGHAHKEGADDKKAAPAAKEAHEEHEERSVKLTEDQVKKAGIVVQAAGPAKLQAAAEFTGEIRFNEDRTAHVVPRLAGVAEQVVANLGQSVRKGEVLAVIASNSLSEQRSELLTAQERRDAARVTYEREKKLWQEKISAEQDYLQAQSALREADIAVRIPMLGVADSLNVASATTLLLYEVIRQRRS